MLRAPPLRTHKNGVLDYIVSEDDYVENYEEISLTYNPNVSLETQAILNCCDLIIDNLSNDEYSVADIGCGAGFVINPIKISPRNKVAVDISLNQLNRVDPEITRIRANVENLPIEDGVFDAVICTDIFEHVQNEKALVREVSRVLRPGGTLLFACPWKQDLSVYDMPEYKAKFKQYKYLHLRSVDEDMINDCFSEFKVVASTEITVAMSSMLFKPYAIRFFQFIKN
tara:strand:+ start:89808 stop:90488 length:681 start_codon:yes stop_codon:yes gene_type:complete